VTKARTLARYTAKRVLRPVLFRHPPIGLEPERFYLWLDTLLRTSTVAGGVVEIGCAAGGTAAFASRMLQRLGVEKRYCCVDTFGGFDSDQFERDTQLGTSRHVRTMFSANSKSLVERTIRSLGGHNVELIQGDIATLDDARLPDQISAALIDVDLSIPVYEALRRVFPRLSPGGVIVVDDCGETGQWRGRVGYERFVNELGLVREFRYDMGIVRHTNPAIPG
jgi:O-methyltransferase